MEKAKEQVIEAIELLAEYPSSEKQPKFFRNLLAQAVARYFPHERKRVAEITNPARHAPKKKEMDASEVEERTYVYGDTGGGVTVNVEPEAKAVKKAKAVPEPQAPPKKKDAAAVEQKSSSDPTDEEVIESFGGLPAAKEWILDQGGKIARNAGVEKTAAKIRKMNNNE